MSETVVENWLERFRETALQYDLKAHMGLISEQVMVFGVPGFDTLDYADWYAQCAHEFPQKLLVGLDYDRTFLRVDETDHILFKTRETTQTSSGSTTSQGIEMLLQQEDGNWKLKQLRILPGDEAAHDGLL